MRAKGCVFLMILALAGAQFASAQVHVELGFNAPVAFTVVNDTGTFSDLTDVLNKVGILPIPYASAYAGWFGESGGIGIGLKAYTAIIATVAYPSIMGQYTISRFSAQASVGGLYMLHYVIGAGFGVTQVPALVSDLSLWFGLDKRRIFHLGAGVTSVVPSDFSFSEIPIVGWLGLKASI